MRFTFLLILALIVCQCKTTSSSANRRTRIQPQETIVIPRESPQATDAAVETEQTVTLQDIDNAPPLPVETRKADAPAAEVVMVQEIGSQCKAPVTANCLGVSSLPTQATAGSLDLGKALKKYGRLITPAVHACNYYNRNLTAFPNISYFTDLVVYWSEGANAINYWAFPVNFIFSAGCSLGDDFKNPFVADLKSTQSWDGITTLKSLGYSFGTSQPLPASFITDRLKAEKIPQDVHKCSWAILPMIYAFPDGVIYQFVGGTRMNVYTNKIVASQGCYLPPPLVAEAAKYAFVCGQKAVNPDPAARLTLAQLKILPQGSVNQQLTIDLLNILETNGKPVERISFNCTFVTRNRILQFADGFAFIDDACRDVNLFTNQSIKDQGCTLP